MLEDDCHSTSRLSKISHLELDNEQNRKRRRKRQKREIERGKRERERLEIQFYYRSATNLRKQEKGES